MGYDYWEVSGRGVIILNLGICDLPEQSDHRHFYYDEQEYGLQAMFFSFEPVGQPVYLERGYYPPTFEVETLDDLSEDEVKRIVQEANLYVKRGIYLYGNVTYRYCF